MSHTIVLLSMRIVLCLLVYIYYSSSILTLFQTCTLRPGTSISTVHLASAKDNNRAGVVLERAVASKTGRVLVLLNGDAHPRAIKLEHLRVDAGMEHDIGRCHFNTMSPELVATVLRTVGELGDDGAATLALAVPGVCKQWRETCLASIDVRIGVRATGTHMLDGHTGHIDWSVPDDQQWFRRFDRIVPKDVAKSQGLLVGRGLESNDLSNILNRFRSVSQLNVQNATMLGWTPPGNGNDESDYPDPARLPTLAADFELAALIAKKSKSLAYLSLTGCQIDESVLVALMANGMPELIEVNLEHNLQFVAGNGFEVFDKCPKLETIRLGCCHNLQANGAKKILKAVPRLKHLSLQCAGIAMEGENAVSIIETLAESCPMLTMLCVTANSNVTQGAIDAFVRLPASCTSLANLQLGSFASANLLLELALHCPSLQQLGVSGAELTDESLKTIGSECLNLKELDASYCAGVSAAAISVGASFMQLTTLKIAQMPGLSDAVLQVVGSNSPHMEVLAFTSTEAVSHRGILSLASSCPHLKDVEIVSLTVTDGVVDAFGSYHELARLFLRNSKRSGGDSSTGGDNVGERIESACSSLLHVPLSGFGRFMPGSYLFNVAGVETKHDKIEGPGGCVMM